MVDHPALIAATLSRFTARDSAPETATSI